MTTSMLMVSAVLLLGQARPLTHIATLTEHLDSPARLAVTATEILVTDPRANAVVRFDLAGTYLGTWSEPAGPVGVAVHPDGRILVSRRDDAKVGVYDGTFTFLRFLGEGNPMVNLIKPTDLAVDASSGRVYVVDSGGDRVYAFEGNEALALILGMRGSQSSQFKYPSAIAIDPANGRMLVADQDNYRVQVFSTSGLFQFRFGYRIKYLPGGEEGWFTRTAGLAVDAQGHIFVTDGLMSTLRSFSTLGAETAKLAEYGFGVGELRAPGDVVIDGTGRILVANSNAGTVEIYAAPPKALMAGRGTVFAGTNLSEEDLKLRRGDLLWGATKAPLAVLLQPEEALNLAGGSMVERPVGYDPPHMLDDVICGRCHGINGQPGGHLGLIEGQTNLCISCHTGAGHALSTAFRSADAADPYGTNPAVADGRGTAHAWGVPAVNALADSVGPVAGGELERYLASGNIKCATCHNQHNNEAGVPFLRVSNAGDAMCKECHAPRDQGTGEGGSHAVGFAYPSGHGEYPESSTNGLPPLKNGKVECLTCHGVHYADSGGANDGAGDGMLLRGANDGTLCRTCHTEHIGHTPGGTWQPTCGECHDIHDPTNVNLALVGRTVYNRTLGIDKSVVFTAETGANSFADGDPAVIDGICEVCHTATTYHKHDGGGAAHNGGQDCTGCHPHAAGFMPMGGSCVDCHGAAQDNGDGVPPGGRRAVVGEFPTGDVHAHYGAELGGDACLVCHSMTTHMDGYVDLIDPDNGSLYHFQRPEDLISDPDVSDFCAHCHDADGAARLPNPHDPFGNGNNPPDVASKFAGTLQWLEEYGDDCLGTEGTQRPVNSHHDISNADQTFSGAKIECLNCHGAHSSGATQPVADPFAPFTPWTGSGNEFCLACHNGGAGPAAPGFPPAVVGPTIALRGIDSCDYQDPMWYVDYTWTNSAHGPNSKRGWNGYSGAPAADLPCTVCHDPHGSYTATNAAGNPYMIRDFVDGSSFVDDGSPGAWTGPPWNTYGATRGVTVTINGLAVDWGGPDSLCMVCHADWLDAMHFHPYCNGCQICHAHGMLWGEYDWEDGDDDTPCPPGLRGAAPQRPARDRAVETGPPVHQRTAGASRMNDRAEQQMIRDGTR
jgi:DNA-binding beta-propeller fold protein YncE